ncbi:T9SS type A sorting domain-containing protein [Mesonia sediminis]|uniref:T9SS type A sorting domain-containing protein n=1 Tax=Mesonia sediminis TaxID=1703946 RepID=A0ABW5SEN1_9FLAO
MKHFNLLLFIVIFINNMNAQNWELEHRSPYESFRFFNTADGLAAIVNESSNELISYHSSAFSGLIVRVKTNLNNVNDVNLQELDWIDLESPMRGGGFNITKINNEHYLFGMGTRRNECSDFIGATIFAKKINPSTVTSWQNQNSPIIRKQLDFSNFDSRANNGIADSSGNYYFCNASEKNIYVINMFNNQNNPINLSSIFNLNNNYIREFRKISDNNYTHIVGLETGGENIVYIRADKVSGNYTAAKYEIDSIINPLQINNRVIRFDNAFDLGLTNTGNAEMLFLTNDNNIYSLNFTQNVGLTKNGKGVLKYNNSVNPSDNLELVRGLSYSDSGKCFLIPKSYYNTNNDNLTFYFDGTNISSTNVNMGGMIFDKIPTINGLSNNNYILTRNHKSTFDTDFERIRLYKTNNNNIIDDFELNLKLNLTTKNFPHGGGNIINSLAIFEDNLLYNEMNFLKYKNLNTNSIDSKYLPLSATSMIPIGNDEFMGGMYYGPYLNRFKIENNTILLKDSHLIDDDFKKIKSLAFDGNMVYVGLYHNSTSNTNNSNIYKFNIQDQTNSTLDNNDVLLNIDETNFVPSLKVVEYPNNQKWLYGLAQHHSNDGLKKYKLFRKALSSNESVEEIILEDDYGSLKDMAVISAINNEIYIYFITQKSNSGDLFKIKITNPALPLQSSNIQHLRNFDTKVPMNIKSFLSKHLIVTFKCKEIGYITQDSNSFLLPFNNMPIPTDFQSDLVVINKKKIFIGTREGVGNIDNNKGGAIYKLELPEYMGFSYQFREDWGLHPSNILSGDINGDGYDDIIATTSENGFIKWNIKLNTQQLDFDNEYSFNLASANSDFIFSGDFNGDGLDDIGVNRISDPNSVNIGEWIIFINDGDGGFYSFNQFRYSWGMQPDNITTGDFNGDGYDDIAIFKINDGWYIKLNNQNNGFQSGHIKYNWASNPDFIFSADFNGDGYDDLGMKNSNFSMGDWIVRFNNKSNSFENQKRYIWGTSPDLITVGDYNNDSFADIAGNRHNDNQSMILGEWIFRLNYGYYYTGNTLDFFDPIGFKKLPTISLNNFNFLVYPNPSFNNKIQITSEESFNYEIYNYYGKKIKEGKKNKSYTVEINGLEKGVYFVKAYYKDSTLTKKILIN